MTDKNQTQIVKDLSNKKITVTRMFDATPEQVWIAWTEKEYLDQWWAPNPWRAETKTLDFRNGGQWLYAMIGPDASKQWCKVYFSEIKLHKSFKAVSVFADEKGNTVADFPDMNWHNEFHATATGTKLIVELSFATQAAFEKIVEMGFEAGFTSALGNLEHYFSTKFKIRKELKNDNKARITSYLNFPGKTEEAFTFYKKIFNGEFTGVRLRLRRFGDIELPAGVPPISEVDKKLIIHAELTILGGYVLMATDAPESMGFKMEHGNNMHINIEPSSREETKRLFDELSVDGHITMPLEDMFWGAYFGSFTDKYGINWMLNYQETI